jgi:hypothetical protein
MWKARADASDESAMPDFKVYRHGAWLPKLFKPHCLARWTDKLRVRQAKQMLLDRGCETVVLYLWRPTFTSALDMISHDLSCYHIDDEYSFSTVERPIDKDEAELLKRVGQVFIHSPALWEKKSRMNPHSLFVPNGVDYAQFAETRVEPDDLKQISHPRMGYIGVIQSTVNWALMEHLVMRHREWSFVFIGPRGFLEPEDQAHVNQLGRFPNAHFLGGKPVQALGAYAQHMSVCMMPYKLNSYTKFIYPLKLHEYLASGRPAVGSPIRSLQDYGHVLTLATTYEEWSQALKISLDQARSHPSLVEQRRAVARSHDWSVLVQRIAGAICSQLSPTHEEKFAYLVRTENDRKTERTR